MSHKCWFTGGQEGRCRKNCGGGKEGTGRGNHDECWKHPHPRQSPSVPERRRGSLRGVKDVELLDVYLLLFDGAQKMISGQVTDRRTVVVKEEMHARGLRLGFQYEGRSPVPKTDTRLGLSSLPPPPLPPLPLPPYLQQSTPDRQSYGI